RTVCRPNGSLASQYSQRRQSATTGGVIRTSVDCARSTCPADDAGGATAPAAGASCAAAARACDALAAGARVPEVRGGASGCEPLRRRRAPPPPAASIAPMSMRAPGTRATCAPIASFARCGGSNCGNSSGDGNGNADGAGGCGLPADTSGLFAVGRSWSWPMFDSPGSVPRRVPVNSAGTSAAEDCTQLLLPATLRPLLQGSRLVGAQ